MRSQVEGSRAIAETVARCRPQVVCAYPISPQTHIVEALAGLVGSGKLPGCEFVNVESEFAALSVAIGASATGARAYTATASQGLLFMAEALYNAAGLGLPIVMTVANRAIGAPINIWNDHSDTMSQRDSGWVQLYAQDNQHAVDLHVLAFRLAEERSLPVMVCVDGFTLTHAVEPVDVPEPERVDRYLPPLRPRQCLDPDAPVTIGALVGPEAFTEVRYLAHRAQLNVLERLPLLADEFETGFGRPVGPVDSYRLEGAETVLVALGSVLGTAKDTVDELRASGLPIGALGLTLFRPFPAAAMRELLAGARRVLVLERAVAAGVGGILAADLAVATDGLALRRYQAVAGLGGRPVTRAALHGLLAAAHADRIDELTFVDLRSELLEAVS
jgi:pyruvate ferredoxin oxidoreductase alpha subunit